MRFDLTNWINVLRWSYQKEKFYLHFFHTWMVSLLWQFQKRQRNVLHQYIFTTQGHIHTKDFVADNCNNRGCTFCNHLWYLPKIKCIVHRKCQIFGIFGQCGGWKSLFSVNRTILLYGTLVNLWITRNEFIFVCTGLFLF